MIRAIIFDCFGVLNADGWSPFQTEIFGDDEDLMRQAQDLNDQSDAGIINYDEFVTGVSKLANISFQEAFSLMENDKSANNHLLATIKELKPNYKIGLLSNVSDNWLAELFTPEQLSSFDAVALSFDTHLMKPLQPAYYDIANKLAVEPEECVFIDDKAINCVAAEACGMRAVVFKNNDQALAELNEILINTKS